MDCQYNGFWNNQFTQNVYPFQEVDTVTKEYRCGSTNRVLACINRCENPNHPDHKYICQIWKGDCNPLINECQQRWRDEADQKASKRKEAIVECRKKLAYAKKEDALAKKHTDNVNVALSQIGTIKEEYQIHDYELQE